MAGAEPPQGRCHRFGVRGARHARGGSRPCSCAAAVSGADRASARTLCTQESVHRCSADPWLFGLRSMNHGLHALFTTPLCGFCSSLAVAKAYRVPGHNQCTSHARTRFGVARQAPPAWQLGFANLYKQERPGSCPCVEISYIGACQVQFCEHFT